MTLYALDSNILVDVARGLEPTLTKTRKLLKDGPEPVVSWMALYEMTYILMRHGKNPERYAEDIHARTKLVSWTEAMLQTAAQVRLTHNLNTADSIIYATAVTQGATLLTKDKDFQGLPGVKVI